MATTFLDLYPDIIAGGLVVGTHASAPLPPPLEWRPGGHPVPDQRNVRAATEALDLCRSLASDDRLLVLISGGASALRTRQPQTLYCGILLSGSCAATVIRLGLFSPGQ